MTTLNDAERLDPSLTSGRRWLESSIDPRNLKVLIR